MARRRDECFLSTKTFWRDRAHAAQQIDQSLKNLGTDHVDNLFMHNVQKPEDLDRILSDDGALRAAEEARQAGKVRFISITSHLPETLLRAVRSYPFDAVMEWINYFDRFNFPLIYDDIIPECVKRGTGVICMKPLADGLLHGSAERAFRWVWSMPEVTSAATGNNDMFQLASNLALAKSYSPMAEAEKERLYFDSPEMANYVCRRCGKCMPNAAGLDIPEIFRLEGYYDRQMMPGPVMTLPDDGLVQGPEQLVRQPALRPRRVCEAGAQGDGRDGLLGRGAALPLSVAHHGEAEMGGAETGRELANYPRRAGISH